MENSPFSSELSLTGSARRLASLRDRHRGERCVLVANGPSLNKMDFRQLVRSGEPIIGMNKIFLGIQKFGFYPRYFVAINPTVLQQASSEIRDLNCVKFLDSRALENGWIPESALTHFLRANAEVDFSRHLELCYQEGFTVTFTALEIAHYLGFQTVILVGLDHRYEFDGKPNESRLLAGADTNHFSPEYFGFGQRWDNPDLTMSEKFYKIARREFEADGRRILDATIGGACQIFEKVDWGKLF